LAKTALGQLGLLGVAGSGASLPNVPAVTLGSGTPAAPQPVHVHVYLDGQPIDDKVATQIDSAVNAIADSYNRQRG
jgi:hypothetical protein